MKTQLTAIMHFLIATFVGFCCASLFHTQIILHELAGIGIEITLNDRAYMSFNDIFGLLPLYGGAITVGFALSFLLARTLKKYISIKAVYIYPLAGSLAMLTILVAMHPIFYLSFLASARTSWGVMLQMLAGLLGGLCFAYLRKPHTKRHLNDRPSV